jgi:DNA-binding transcriptional LysR family regulator
MDTEALRWFQLVADGTTVTEVGDAEDITQSGVSRALRRLEEQLGTPLLRRSGRTLRLTHAGAVFKQHVDVVLHHLDDGVAAVNQLLEPDTGTVALAFQQSLGSWLVPGLVRGFRSSHPRVGFQLTQVRDEAGYLGLASGRADLEIGTRRPRDAAVRTRRLALEPLRLALPAGHVLAEASAVSLAGPGPVSLASVSGEPFVSVRPDAALRQLGDELCERAGFRPEVVFEGDDLSTVRGFVAAGLGVAIVPAPRAGSPEAGPGPVVYREIADPGAVREICLAWPADRRLLPSAELFRRHTIRVAVAGQFPALSD